MICNNLAQFRYAQNIAINAFRAISNIYAKVTISVSTFGFPCFLLTLDN